MPNPEIENFVAILVREVRDAAVQSCDRNLSPDATHIVADRWRQLSRTGQMETIAKMLIPDIVDDTIFQLLRAIDQGVLQLSFTDSKGKTVDLAKQGSGELGGWYMGEWRAKYTKERFVDDFADLR